MARWPMAALLSSVAPIGCHPSDVRGMSPAWNRSAAALLGGGGAYLCRQSWFRAPPVPRPLACSRPRRLRHSSNQKRTKISTIKVEIMIAARATIHTPAAAPPQQLSSHPYVPRSSPSHRRLPQLDGQDGGPACGSRRSHLRHQGPNHWPRCPHSCPKIHKSDVSITRTRCVSMRLPTWPGLVPAGSPHTRRLQRRRFGR